ncbi:uncharacterized protein MYCFIDRAFT_179919 [Pseudocercospora fijiensis CIRAD86]|uniref:Uncharacterized protein n=1 Tax=Pseudocercospora fijiensis (strain CIRAD86) TaxID=383855 RepID=M3AJK3_PSEFD|nr:uncharacterized protein MYCFIDRAFT_179919 [Pseudocercospora fijiensis CIRAD86]EME77343.1 hypothetical protein MYCFIDRAFT_179919 [Pseudocercospora fijiensis CIRAD86]
MRKAAGYAAAARRSEEQLLPLRRCRALPAITDKLWAAHSTSVELNPLLRCPRTHRAPDVFCLYATYVTRLSNRGFAFSLCGRRVKSPKSARQMLLTQPPCYQLTLRSPVVQGSVVVCNTGGIKIGDLLSGIRRLKGKESDLRVVIDIEDVFFPTIEEDEAGHAGWHWKMTRSQEHKNADSMDQNYQRGMVSRERSSNQDSLKSVATYGFTAHAHSWFGLAMSGPNGVMRVYHTPSPLHFYSAILASAIPLVYCLMRQIQV